MGLTAEAPRPPPASEAGRRRFLPTGWAYIAMVAWYPLWWALGLGAVTWTLFAVPMAIALYVRRPIAAPRGTGMAILFLLCVLLSVVQVDSADRMAGYVLRTSYYLGAVTVWLYLVNATDSLSTRRVFRALLALWGATVIGGGLGMVLPNVSWAGPAGLLVPAGLRANSLINDLTTPGFAEVADIVGVTIARPKAPFTYTNGWGSTIALLTPVALAALAGPWFGRTARRWIRIGLVASVVPVLGSLNRGLWALLVLGGLYVVIRRSPGGRSRATAMVFLALLAVATAVVATPLGDPVRDALGTRADDSNERRTILYEETFERTLDSPVVGYGAPRPSERTEQSVGSHGQLWNVMFSHGFVATALYLGLLASFVWQSRDPASSAEMWLHVALVLGLVQTLFYGQLPQQLFVIVSVAALTHRLRSATAEPVGPGLDG